jgi:hypothetical protein
MSNLTYNALVERLAAFLERARPGSQSHAEIPAAINRSERIIVGDLKLQGYEATLHDFMRPGEATYTKPDRFRLCLSQRIISGGQSVPMFTRNYEWCRVYAPDDSVRGTPKFYADNGDKHWNVFPTPDAAYPWELKCYLLPKPLSDSVQTNWLTDYNPDALLWQTLKQMALFLKKYDEAQTFDAEYKTALGQKGTEDAQKIMDRSAERGGV